MELTGKIIAVLPAQSGTSNRTGNPWMSQEYVLETHDQYPRKCCFRVFGEDKIKQFNIQSGEEITVSFDIDASEWQGRWFNRINAWAVNRNVQNNNPVSPEVVPPFETAPAAPVFPPANDSSSEASADDLPF